MVLTGSRRWDPFIDFLCIRTIFSIRAFVVVREHPGLAAAYGWG